MSNYVFIPGKWQQWMPVSAEHREPGDEAMVDIQGLDKAMLFDTMFYYGLGDANYCADDEIDKIITNGLGYIDRFEGVVFKIDFSKPIIDAYHYNKHTQGELNAQQIVDYLRQKKG